MSRLENFDPSAVLQPGLCPHLPSTPSPAAPAFQLELAAFNADKLDAAMTRRVFEEHGLQPACSLGLSLDADISSADPGVVARGAAELEGALRFASAIGARHLAGILYSALAKYPGPPSGEGRANAVREVRALAGRAADQGVQLCLEVVNRWGSRGSGTPGPCRPPQMCVPLVRSAKHPVGVGVAPTLTAGCSARVGMQRPETAVARSVGLARRATRPCGLEALERALAGSATHRL